MALTKYKLGELLIRNSETNVNLKYDISNVRGVRNTKGIASTKVDVSERDLRKFLVVKPGGFIFNHRVHDKLGLGYNTSNETYIFTNDYVAFYVKTDIEKSILLPDYLYMWYLRSEFDRYMLFKTYGSATLFFSWEDMCELEIELPDLPTQQKYVDIYNAMVANQQTYERSLEDLKLVCDGYIEDLRRKMPCEKIGKYIEKGEKNTDGNVHNVRGIGQNGFILPQKEPNESLKNYKVLKKGDICYAPPLYNILTGAMHLYKEENPAVCSPIYEVFSCKQNVLLPGYLILWLKRDEFKRYAPFYALGVRQTFDYSLMEEVQIPIPDLSVQKAISEVFDIYTKRKEINEKLKAQIKDICPILIKGSLEEG